MTLSRIRIALLIALGAAPAQAVAQPALEASTGGMITADQALANFRLVVKPIDELRCPKNEAGEIVVCARRRERLEFDPVPGERPGRVAGEPPRGAVGGFSCLQSCHQPLMINILKAPGAIRKGIARILGKD
jgi:hypothetical protein